MIVSKPQPSTLLSFTLFLVITAIVLGLNLQVILAKQAAWYHYLIIVLLVPIGMFVLYKIFIRYKIIRMGNNMIEIEYPVLRQHEKYPIKSIVAWRENRIKTGKNSTYQQLEILFDSKKRIGIGQREHTEYKQLITYLTKKAGGKKTAGDT